MRTASLTFIRLHMAVVDFLFPFSLPVVREKWEFYKQQRGRIRRAVAS